MMADGKPVFVQAGIEQGFKITAGAAGERRSRRSHAPHLHQQPLEPVRRRVHRWTELQALGEVLRKHPRIVIASDDMYEHILLDGSKFVNILNACPDLYDRTVVENGVSKAYSMTGWRIGYCGGPQELIEAMENVQSHSTSNPTSISQYAAEAALNGDQSCIGRWSRPSRSAAQFVAEALNRIPGVKCLPPAGAFYVFPDCREAIQRLAAAGKLKAATDVALCDYLMEQHGSGRRRAGLRVRHRGLPAHLLRDVDGKPAEGHGAHGPRDVLTNQVRVPGSRTGFIFSRDAPRGACLRRWRAWHPARRPGRHRR